MTDCSYRAAVVRWPEDWQPRNDSDAPAEIEVVETIDAGASLTHVTRWVRQFNRNALTGKERDRWAVILTAGPRTSAESLPPASASRPAASRSTQERRDELERLNRPGPSDGRYGLA